MKGIQHSTPTKQQQQLTGATTSPDTMARAVRSNSAANSSSINNNPHQLSALQSMQYKLQTEKHPSQQPMYHQQQQQQLQLQQSKSSPGKSASLNSSNSTNLHPSSHHANAKVQQQSMDQLLERLKDEMTELGNQGDAYTKQILSMYATFEDLMHNNSTSTAASASTANSSASASASASFDDMANVTKIRESFELTLLKNSSPHHGHNLLNGEAVKSSLINSSSSTGSSRKSSASSIESSSSSSSSSTFPSASPIVIASVPVKSPRKSLLQSTNVTSSSGGGGGNKDTGSSPSSSCQLSPKPIPLPRTSRNDHPSVSIPLASNSSHLSHQSSCKVNLTTHSKVPSLTYQSMANVKYPSVGSNGTFDAKEMVTGDFVGVVVAATDCNSNGNSNNGNCNSSGVVGKNNTTGTASVSGIGGFSHPLDGPKPSVRASKQPLVTVAPSARSVKANGNCNSPLVSSTVPSGPNGLAPQLTPSAAAALASNGNSASLAPGNCDHSDSGSCCSINNSLLDTISTLRAPYSDSDDEEGDGDDCDEDEDEDVQVVGHALALTDGTIGNTCQDITPTFTPGGLNSVSATTVITAGGTKVIVPATMSQQANPLVTCQRLQKQMTSDASSSMASQRNLLRTKRKTRKSQLARPRSPCHLSSSDGDSITGGYAGSNSIDSGYKSFCPTPDQVSDSSVQSSDSSRAKGLIGNKKKSMTLASHMAPSYHNCSVSLTLATGGNGDHRPGQEMVTSHASSDKLMSNKSGTLGSSTNSSGGLYAAKMAARLKSHQADSHLEHLLNVRQNLINAINRVGSSAGNSASASPIASRGASPVVSSRSNSPAVTVIAAARAASASCSLYHSTSSTGGHQSSYGSSPSHHPGHHFYHHQQSPLVTGSPIRRCLPMTPNLMTSDASLHPETGTAAGTGGNLSGKLNVNQNASNDASTNEISSYQTSLRSSTAFTSLMHSASSSSSSSASTSASAPGASTTATTTGLTVGGGTINFNTCNTNTNSTQLNTLSSTSSSSVSASASTTTASASSSSTTPSSTGTANLNTNAGHGNHSSSKCVRFDKDVKVTSFAQLPLNFHPEGQAHDEDASDVESGNLTGETGKGKSHHLHKDLIKSDRSTLVHGFNYNSYSQSLTTLNSALGASSSSSGQIKASLGGQLPNCKLPSNSLLPLVHGSIASTTVNSLAPSNATYGSNYKCGSKVQPVDSPHASPLAAASSTAATKSILRDPICESMRSQVKSGEFTNDTSSTIESEIDSLLFGSCKGNSDASSLASSSSSLLITSNSVALEPITLTDDIPYVTMIEDKYRNSSSSTGQASAPGTGATGNMAASASSTIGKAMASASSSLAPIGPVSMAQGTSFADMAMASLSTMVNVNGPTDEEDVNDAIDAATKVHLMQEQEHQQQQGENEKSVAGKFVQVPSLVSSSPASSSLPSAATGAMAKVAARSGSTEKLITNQLAGSNGSTIGGNGNCNNGHGRSLDGKNEPLMMRERVERIINERTIRLQQQQQQQGLNESTYGEVINYACNKVPLTTNEVSSSLSPSMASGHDLTSSTNDGSMTPASSVTDTSSSCLSSQSSTEESFTNAGDSTGISPASTSNISISSSTGGNSSSSSNNNNNNNSNSASAIVPSATISAILDKHLKRNKKKSAIGSVNCSGGSYVDGSANGSTDGQMVLDLPTPMAMATTSAPAASECSARVKPGNLVTSCTVNCSAVTSPRNSDLESVHSYSTLAELHIYEEVAEDNYDYHGGSKDQHLYLEHGKGKATSSPSHSNHFYIRQSNLPSVNSVSHHQHQRSMLMDKMAATDVNLNGIVSRGPFVDAALPRLLSSASGHQGSPPPAPAKLSLSTSCKRRGNIFALMRDSDTGSSTKLSINGTNDLMNDTTGGSSSLPSSSESEYGFEATV